MTPEEAAGSCGCSALPALSLCPQLPDPGPRSTALMQKCLHLLIVETEKTVAKQLRQQIGGRWRSERLKAEVTAPETDGLARDPGLQPHIHPPQVQGDTGWAGGTRSQQ